MSIRALTEATPQPRKSPVRGAPVLGPYVETVRDWLTADLDAPVNSGTPPDGSDSG